MLSLLTAGQISLLLPAIWPTGSELIGVRERRTRLSGISPRTECSVEGRIQTVKTTVLALALELKLSVCFAEGDAPCLIGREAFFDRFRVTFDKPNWRTTFALTR